MAWFVVALVWLFFTLFVTNIFPLLDGGVKNAVEIFRLKFRHRGITSTEDWEKTEPTAERAEQIKGLPTVTEGRLKSESPEG